MINKSLNQIYKTIPSYCLKRRKSTERKNQKVMKTKNGKIMLSSNCAVFNCKKPKFIKEPKRRDY